MTDISGEMHAPHCWSDPLAHAAVAADSPWYQRITLLNASIMTTTFDFYRSRNVAPVLMPITVSSVSSPMGLGSDSVPVQVELFGDTTYLADSMQFQLEFMLRHGLQGAYYVMPTFRGEEPDATHLNQFFHSEAEIRGGLDDVMRLVEDYIAALTRELLTGSCRPLIERSTSVDHLEDLVVRPRVPRITFDEALDLLGTSYFEEPSAGSPVISRAGEQRLIAHYGGAVWLSHPPCETVPFYQRIDERGRAMSADLLLGIGEVVGCGARHVGETELRASLADHEVDPADYAWYVDMKERHPLETAGFGLGVERLLLWVLQHDDIRDMQVMPRLRGVGSQV